MRNYSHKVSKEVMKQGGIKMKDIFDSKGNKLVDSKKLLESFNTMKMILTLKETENLVENILHDIRMKLDIDTNTVVKEFRELLESEYKPLN